MNESTLPSATERIIKWSTAAAVVCVATVAAVVSYDHAYALVRTYGEDGWTARLVPLTVEGLIYASSMVLLHSARRRMPVPRLARWLLGVGIAATLAANAAHGLGHGPVGAMVAAWPAVGTYELLMLIIRRIGPALAERPATEDEPSAVPEMEAPTESVSAAVPDPDPNQVRAAEHFAELLATGAVPSVRTIRSELRVGQPRAQHIRSYLSALVAAAHRRN
jgi:hypothetical protein